MSLQSVAKLSFEILDSRPIEIEISDSPLSSDAGLLPIAQFDERIGLTAQFAAALEFIPKKVESEPVRLVLQVEVEAPEGPRQSRLPALPGSEKRHRGRFGEPLLEEGQMAAAAHDLHYRTSFLICIPASPGSRAPVHLATRLPGRRLGPSGIIGAGEMARRR